jgi:hypothetical protein
MKKQDILKLLKGDHDATASNVINKATEIVENANELTCVIGEPAVTSNLENIYKARHERLVKLGQSVPLGLAEAIDAFTEVSGRSLETCYIRADGRLIYFWRNNSVIIAMIIT